MRRPAALAWLRILRSARFASSRGRRRCRWAPHCERRSLRRMDQREYWDGEAGTVWAAHADKLDIIIGPFGKIAIEALAPRAGERVLDIGCGAGATSRALAALVGPSGSVLGVDVSGPLLATARARGGGPAFHLGDAGCEPIPGAPFDAAFSRFGVMFFPDPPGAFAHLRAALRPGGRIGFVCWRSMMENAWAQGTLAAALPLLREPPVAPPPDAPGPFSFADAGRLRGILEGAGWSGVEIKPLDTGYVMGATPEEAAETMLHIGPLSRLIREQALDPAPFRQMLLDLLRRNLGEQGPVLAAACWIVTATA